MKKPALCSRQRLSPQGRIVQVPLADIRTLLLALFEQWGLPLGIRTDNGSPFGVPTRDIIPILSLWLVAWGIKPILNRPRRPQDNAKVERNQGTASRWSEVYSCLDVESMQTKLDQMGQIQRDHYPVKRLGNQTRRKVFPDLYHIKRPFDPKAFDPDKAYQYLEQATFPRKVSASGVIQLYNKDFNVGMAYKHQIVKIKFQAQSLSWVALDDKNQTIKLWPDDRFSPENLFNLTVYQ